MVTRWLVSCALVVAVACGGEKKKETPAQDPSTMTDDQIVEAGFQVMLDMSEISATHVNDCDRAAEALGAFIDRHGAMIAAFQRVGADPAKREAVVTKRAKELELIAERSIRLEENCRDHAGFAAVTGRLAGPKKVVD